jgi:dihydrofolate synthase/folylpolyglutamate synthase
VRFTERFRINRKEISKKRVAELTYELKDIINPDHPPTYFEVTTAMALTYFAREKCDISIMEVGMGGRLDATNIIRPVVTSITNISLEHQFFLGNRLLDIAGEKAGIIKKGVDLVTAATQPSVIKLFERICAEKKAPFWRIGKDIRYRSKNSGLFYYGIKRVLRDLKVGLRGGFQDRNIALSLAIIELLEGKGFNISSGDIIKGLRETDWPGRMHIISDKPLIILDGAHNPRAVRELAVSVAGEFSPKSIILVLGIMEDKDIGRIMAGITEKADHVICTRPEYYRSADPEILMRYISSRGKAAEVVPSISDAIQRAKELATPRDMILVTGSLFTVGEALTYFDPVKYRPDGIQ